MDVEVEVEVDGTGGLSCEDIVGGGGYSSDEVYLGRGGDGCGGRRKARQARRFVPPAMVQQLRQRHWATRLDWTRRDTAFLYVVACSMYRWSFVRWCRRSFCVVVVMVMVMVSEGESESESERVLSRLV